MLSPVGDVILLFEEHSALSGLLFLFTCFPFFLSPIIKAAHLRGSLWLCRDLDS